MRSVPRYLTARKQNGKSRAVRARYTPSADQPYSRESLRSRCERERFASLAPAWVDWKRREDLEAFGRFMRDRGVEDGKRRGEIDCFKGLVRKVDCVL
jgi:hypothetical protein